MRKIQVELGFWLNFGYEHGQLRSNLVWLSHCLYSMISICLSTVLSNWPIWNPFVVITTESKNILLRHIYQRADEKVGDQFFMLHILTNKYIPTSPQEHLQREIIFLIAVETKESCIRKSFTRAWMQATEGVCQRYFLLKLSSGCLLSNDSH